MLCKQCIFSTDYQVKVIGNFGIKASNSGNFSHGWAQHWLSGQ